LTALTMYQFVFFCEWGCELFEEAFSSSLVWYTFSWMFERQQLWT